MLTLGRSFKGERNHGYTIHDAAVMCALLTLAVCAEPPTEQIEAVEKAIKVARANGASTYVPGEYAKIARALSRLKKEVTDQDGKLDLFRDYGKVEQLAVTAKSEAERLKTGAIKKKEEAKAAALQAKQVAQKALTATPALVAKVPTGKDRTSLESIKADAESLQSSLNQVQMTIDTVDYPTVYTKAEAIHEKSQAVYREVEAALARIGEGRPSAAKKNEVR